MATIYKRLLINAPAAAVWDAVRDFGALHTRLARGFVTDCRVEGDERVDIFFNDNVVREKLVGIDAPNMRLCYAAVGGRTSHHSASVQVVADGPDRSLFIWITDVLPNEFATPIDAMMTRGAEAIKQTLETA